MMHGPINISSLIEFMTVIMFQMHKFTTLCVLECMQTFTCSCKCSYGLTPESLGVKYRDTCHSTKCYEVSDVLLF